jgi:hypothetical protein
MILDTKKILQFGGLVGATFSLSLVAANLVFAPYKAEARERVRFMCAWAKHADARQTRTEVNAYRACVASAGISVCERPADPEPNPLLDECIKR